jgi:CRISPR-associated exonuclease Cas4
MFGTVIESGALFYGMNRRRTEVRFDAALRKRTEELARRMHPLYWTGVTPAAVYAKKCENCSLYNRCLPRTTSKRAAVERYMASALKDVEIVP